MKKIWWLIPCLILILTLAVTGCAPSQQIISVPAQQSTGIWVTGQGEITAVPDIANLSLGIESRSDTVSEAQAQASVAMGDVMRALKDNGVKEEDIQTQRYAIYPITRWDDDRGEEIIGYRVTNMVIAKVRKVDEAGVIIDAVAKAGGDYIRIRDISFTVDDPTPYYEEARSKAVEDAENKARQFASLTSVKLGQPTYISEGTVYTPSNARDFYEGAATVPAPVTPISPGELNIRVNIQIVYAIA